MVIKATGDSPELKTLDTLHTQLKEIKGKGQKPSPTDKSEHATLAQNLYRKVTAKKQDHKVKVKLYEQNYVSKNLHLPNDQEYSKLTKELRYLKWLLSVWDTHL